MNVTKDNTTLFASDRDMFVFLADEENRIEFPNRRAGKFGSFARGFFVGNTEVGKSTLCAGFFLFDYVCCNRIIWGADQYTEVRIRHTKGAPDRWLEEVTPVLEEYARAARNRSCRPSKTRSSKRIDDELTTFLAKRFGKQMAPAITAIHETEEGRPIETLWDVTVAATAHARTVEHGQAARNRTRRGRAAETRRLAQPRPSRQQAAGVEASRHPAPQENPMSLQTRSYRRQLRSMVRQRLALRHPRRSRSERPGPDDALVRSARDARPQVE